MKPEVGSRKTDHRDFAGACGRSEDADLCREHGISSATYYKWKAKFGGLDVSDAKRLKSLGNENAKLKRLLAEAVLDNAMLKDIATEMVTPAARREAVARLQVAYEVSERRHVRRSEPIAHRSDIAAATQTKEHTSAAPRARRNPPSVRVSATDILLAREGIIMNHEAPPALPRKTAAGAPPW